MKTLAEFKRRLTPGVRLTWTHYGMTIKGNLVKVAIDPLVEPRIVDSADNSKVTFIRPNGSKSYFYWPQASECIFGKDGNTIDIVSPADRHKIMTYTFL